MVAADEEPAVGILRIDSVQHPQQVVPSARVMFVIDVEYAVHGNVTIRSSLHEGPPDKLGAELWHSDPTVVFEGGDMIWTVNLTAPSTEMNWTLTVFAYYLENGDWKYFANSDQGPGVEETTVKVARLATLEVDLGESNIPVNVDNSTQQTTDLGMVTFQLPLGVAHNVTVPSVQPCPNSTRLVFVGWQDGINETHRTLNLDGNARIVGSYKTEYLLQVTSIVSGYASSEWYDAGSNITLRADSSIPVNGTFGFLKLRYVFKGWSGDVNSDLDSVNVTMNKPKTISANFAVDYTQAVVPAIIAVGIVVGIVLGVLSMRRRVPAVQDESQQDLDEAEEEKTEEVVRAESVPSRFCDGCGEPVEEEWSHCVHCGRALGPSESAQSR